MFLDSSSPSEFSSLDARTVDRDANLIGNANTTFARERGSIVRVNLAAKTSRGRFQAVTNCLTVRGGLGSAIDVLDATTTWSGNSSSAFEVTKAWSYTLCDKGTLDGSFGDGCTHYSHAQHENHTWC